MNTLDHLRKASELMADDPVANRSRLSEAAGHFWSATFDEENWPLPLRVASTSLKAKLLVDGTIIKTVHSLDPEQASAIVDELARFCLEARDHLATDRHASIRGAHFLDMERSITQASVMPRS